MPDHGAIVFTDIVGFTALTDMHGDDVALALLERQEAMVRAALPAAARVVKENWATACSSGSTTRVTRSTRACGCSTSSTR